MRRVVLRDIITAIGLCLAVVTHNIKYSCYVPKPLTAQQHSGNHYILHTSMYTWASVMVFRMCLCVSDIQRETADLDQKGKVHVAQI